MGDGEQETEYHGTLNSPERIVTGNASPKTICGCSKLHPTGFIRSVFLSLWNVFGHSKNITAFSAPGNFALGCGR